MDRRTGNLYTKREAARLNIGDDQLIPVDPSDARKVIGRRLRQVRRYEAKAERSAAQAAARARAAAKTKARNRSANKAARAARRRNR